MADPTAYPLIARHPDEPEEMIADDEYQRAEMVRPLSAAVADFNPEQWASQYTPEWWEKREKELAQTRARDVALTEAVRVNERAGELKDNGFPLLFVDSALAGLEDTTALRHSRLFVQTYSRILVLAGGVGCGKTTAATWVALKGQDPRPGFIRTSELERRGRYDKELGKWFEDRTSLVIDDVGTEVLDGKGVFRSLLEEVLDVFYSNKRRLVITTNLRPKKTRPADEPQFFERYGARVWSRVTQAGEWGDCGMTDMRRER